MSKVMCPYVPTYTKKKQPKVFTLVFVPHSQKRSRSVSISMKSVFVTLIILLFGAAVITGAISYKRHNERKTLISAIRETSYLEKRSSQMSSLSEELLLNINQLSEENSLLMSRNTALAASLAATETKIDSLISQAEVFIQRLEDLSSAENEIRQQVGLNSEGEGGVGGAISTDFELEDGLKLEDKLEYAIYLYDSIMKVLNYTEQNWSVLSSDVDDYKIALEHIPHCWPVPDDDEWQISSYFGWRTNPFNRSTKEYHEGIDICDDPGTDILASASGTVKEAGFSSGWGYTIVIDHGNGYSTRYSHCSKLLVKKGDEIKQGDVIAYMGKTGRATGTHVDFRVYYNDDEKNPLDYLDKRD